MLVAGSAVLDGTFAFGLAAVLVDGTSSGVRRRFGPVSPPGRRVPIAPRR
jgi:hypothetical protein